MNKKAVITEALIFVLGGGIGFTSGYLIAKRKAEKLFDGEIEAIRDSFNPRKKTGPLATPEGAVKALITDARPASVAVGRALMDEMLEDAGYKVPEEMQDEWKRQSAALAAEEYVDISVGLTPEPEPEIDLPDPEETKKSIWTDSMQRGTTEAMDALSDEMPPRDLDKPYIITVAQFMDDETHGESKLTLTYFEADDQLTDERDQLVPNVEANVGENNMHRFGLGSDDRNVVYIRNERLACDFEVVRDLRSFSEVVLNIRPDRVNLSPRKMRDNDE